MSSRACCAGLHRPGHLLAVLSALLLLGMVFAAPPAAAQVPCGSPTYLGHHDAAIANNGVTLPNITWDLSTDTSGNTIVVGLDWGAPVPAGSAVTLSIYMAPTFYIGEIPISSWSTVIGPTAEAGSFDVTTPEVLLPLIESGQVGVPLITAIYVCGTLPPPPPGSLTIIKHTVPTGGTGFGFDGGMLGEFTLDDGQSRVFDDLTPGFYQVFETGAEDWEFAGVECDAADWEAEGSAVELNLAAGEAAVCTFTNGQLPVTGPNPWTAPLGVGGGAAVLLGLALVLGARHQRAERS